MAESLPPNIPRMLKHYRLIRRLGTGGMGSVFEGEDRRDRSRVAVKFLHPHLAEDEAFRERFEREAHVAALLRSPYTVHLLDYGQAEGHLFLVMEYVDGPSVAKLIEERPLSPGRAVRIASEVARALEEAEARGVVHRDIKPENILIVGEDTVKVADFGIARRVGGGGVTEVGGFVGSVLYASPEQARGDADRRSDIYSLGAVLYAMLAGHPPFAGSPLDVMRQHAEASLPVGPLHDLPDPFVNIVRRCLEKDPQDRYQSASELAGALERAQRYLRNAETKAAAPAITSPAPFADVATHGRPEAAPTSVAGQPPPGGVDSPDAPASTERPLSLDATAAPPLADSTVVTGGSTASPQIAPETVAGPPDLPEQQDTTVVARSAPGDSTTRPGRGGDTAQKGPQPKLEPRPVANAAAPSSSRKRLLFIGAGVAGLALVGVILAVVLRPRDDPGAADEITGANLVEQLDDLATEAFQGFGATTSRVSKPSSGATEEGAINSVKVSGNSQGMTAVVEMVVFPHAADARRYINGLLQQADLSGESGCSTGSGLPGATISGDSRTCYQRAGDVVVIASVPPSADPSEADALVRRSAEVIAAVRKGETPPRATAFVARPPSVAPSPAGSSTPGSTVTTTAATPTATVRPTATVVPIPIASGVWTYDFGVTSNSCPFGLAVGSRFPTAYLLAEVGTADGLISPGELVDVTQDGSDFYIGRFTFTFPTFEFSYPVTSAGESGTARVTNTYQDANTGTANLVEVYLLRAGGSCSFLSAE